MSEREFNIWGDWRDLRGAIEATDPEFMGRPQNERSALWKFAEGVVREYQPMKTRCYRCNAVEPHWLTFRCADCKTTYCEFCIRPHFETERPATRHAPPQGVGGDVGKLKAADLAWWTVRRVANGDATRPWYEIPDEDRTALIDGIVELEQKAEARWRVQDSLHAELLEAKTDYENMAICRDIANDRALAAEAALRRRLLFCKPDEDPVKYAAEVEVIAAAGRIFDLFGGPKWRERADISSVYESADWEAALSYARAALSSAQALATPSSEGEGLAADYANDDLGESAPWCAFINPEGYRPEPATPSPVSLAIGGDERLAEANGTIRRLYLRLVDLLEIARQWEPDHASAEHRSQLFWAREARNDALVWLSRGLYRYAGNAEVSHDQPALAALGSGPPFSKLCLGGAEQSDCETNPNTTPVLGASHG